MKLAFALIVLAASPAFAEKHTIGATTFDSPPSWDLQADSADYATMVHSANKAIGIAVVSTPRTSTDFASEWNRVAKLTPVAAPKPTKRTIGKHTVYEGIATGTSDGQPVIIDVMMADFSGQVVTTLIYVQDKKTLDSFRAQLDQLVGSIDIVVAPPPAPVVAAAPPSGPVTLTTISMSDLVGTWRSGAGNSTDYANSSGSYTGSVTTVSGESFVIKADGSYSRNFSGMQNGQVSKSSSTGTVSLSGELVIFTENKQVVRKNKFIDYSIAADGSAQWRMINAQYPATKINIDLYKEVYVRAPIKK